MELTFVIPIILLIVLATIEISRVLKAAQIANELSQEASNSIYRRCSDFIEPAGETSTATLTRTQQCVQSVYDTEFAPIVAQLAPPGTIRIILSIYRYVAGPSVMRFALVNDGPSPTSTRFAVSGTGVNSNIKNIYDGSNVQLNTAFMSGNRRIAIAEVFIQIDPIMQLIPILNSAVVGGNYYAASVL